jgi:hypothetical protein
MVQNTQPVAVEEEQLDARLAELLHMMRHEHLTRIEPQPDHDRTMSRAAI